MAKQIPHNKGQRLPHTETTRMVKALSGRRQGTLAPLESVEEA